MHIKATNARHPPAASASPPRPRKDHPRRPLVRLRPRLFRPLGPCPRSDSPSPPPGPSPSDSSCARTHPPTRPRPQAPPRRSHRSHVSLAPAAAGMGESRSPQPRPQPPRRLPRERPLSPYVCAAFDPDGNRPRDPPFVPTWAASASRTAYPRASASPRRRPGRTLRPGRPATLRCETPSCSACAPTPRWRSWRSR